MSGLARTARACGTARALLGNPLVFSPQLLAVIKVKSSPYLATKSVRQC